MKSIIQQDVEIEITPGFCTKSVDVARSCYVDPSLCVEIRCMADYRACMNVGPPGFYVANLTSSSQYWCTVLASNHANIPDFGCHPSGVTYESHVCKNYINDTVSCHYDGFDCWYLRSVSADGSQHVERCDRIDCSGPFCNGNMFVGTQRVTQCNFNAYSPMAMACHDENTTSTNIYPFCHKSRTTDVLSTFIQYHRDTTAEGSEFDVLFDAHLQTFELEYNSTFSVNYSSTCGDDGSCGMYVRFSSMQAMVTPPAPPTPPPPAHPPQIPSLPDPPPPPPCYDTIVDDTSSVLVGTWLHSTDVGGYYGSGYMHDNNQSKGFAMAVFDSLGVFDGNNYDLLIKYTTHPNRASNTKLVITSGSSNATIHIDQRVSASEWNSLGQFLLTDTSSIRVDNTDTDGYVVVDAFKFSCATTSQTESASCVNSDTYSSFSKPYDGSASVVDLLNIISALNGNNDNYNLQQRIDKCLDIDGDGVDNNDLQAFINVISGLSVPPLPVSTDNSPGGCACSTTNTLAYARCVCF